uniref:EF-hand domain-containing protein n=1 Tax=Palpitomonas bilix TaxID=652834 RepID=A0A7S3G6Z6_9EUKA|mmetsp:Transcript_26607/g.68299  ORF Transcript_26607/g.68299 Transcript_26607/m.68299 type:complete len:1104 (+) Transcript_26607:301-3612(+)
MKLSLLSFFVGVVQVLRWKAKFKVKKGKSDEKERLKTEAKQVKDAGEVKTAIGKNEQRRVSIVNQGNEAFYSDENLNKRMAIRDSWEMVVMVEKWWRFLPKSDSGRIAKQTYISMFMQLTRLLGVKNEGKVLTRAELIEAAEQEWMADANDSSEMTYSQFYHCIFELADTWSDSVNAADYASFLERVLRRLKPTLLFRPTAKKIEVKPPSPPPPPKKVVVVEPSPPPPKKKINVMLPPKRDIRMPVFSQDVEGEEFPFGDENAYKDMSFFKNIKNLVKPLVIITQKFSSSSDFRLSPATPLMKSGGGKKKRDFVEALPDPIKEEEGGGEGVKKQEEDDFFHVGEHEGKGEGGEKEGRDDTWMLSNEDDAALQQLAEEMIRSKIAMLEEKQAVVRGEAGVLVSPTKMALDLPSLLEREEELMRTKGRLPPDTSSVRSQRAMDAMKGLSSDVDIDNPFYGPAPPVKRVAELTADATAKLSIFGPHWKPKHDHTMSIVSVGSKEVLKGESDSGRDRKGRSGEGEEEGREEGGGEGDRRSCASRDKHRSIRERPFAYIGPFTASKSFIRKPKKSEREVTSAREDHKEGEYDESEYVEGEEEEEEVYMNTSEKERRGSIQPKPNGRSIHSSSKISERLGEVGDASSSSRLEVVEEKVVKMKEKGEIEVGERSGRGERGEEESGRQQQVQLQQSGEEKSASEDQGGIISDSLPLPLPLRGGDDASYLNSIGEMGSEGRGEREQGYHPSTAHLSYMSEGGGGMSSVPPTFVLSKRREATLQELSASVLSEEAGLEGVNWGHIKRSSHVKPPIHAPEVVYNSLPTTARDHYTDLTSPFRVGPQMEAACFRVDMGDAFKSLYEAETIAEGHAGRPFLNGVELPRLPKHRITSKSYVSRPARVRSSAPQLETTNTGSFSAREEGSRASTMWMGGNIYPTPPLSARATHCEVSSSMRGKYSRRHEREARLIVRSTRRDIIHERYTERPLDFDSDPHSSKQGEALKETSAVLGPGGWTSGVSSLRNTAAMEERSSMERGENTSFFGTSSAPLHDMKGRPSTTADHHGISTTTLIPHLPLLKAGRREVGETKRVTGAIRSVRTSYGRRTHLHVNKY